MDSDLPKVLHKINNKTMIEHVIEKTKKLNPEKLVIVVGYKYKEVKKCLSNYSLDYVLQKEQKGTGHAVIKCKQTLKDFNGNTLILSGDVPLITQETLINLYEAHINNAAAATILSAKSNEPFGYGRIIRNQNNFISIVEEKDSNKKEKNIDEINAGIYIFKNNVLFENIKEINNNNNQSEYYLPSIMPILIQKGHKVIVFKTNNQNEIKGANTVEQLLKLETYAEKKTKN